MKVHSQAWSAAAIALAVLGTLAVPGWAGASDPGPPLSGTLPGNGYVAVKLDWSGVGDVTLHLGYGIAPGGTVFGAGVVRPDGTTWGVIAKLSGILGNDDCVILRTEATGSVHEACEASTVQDVVFPPVDGAHGNVAMVISEEDDDPAGVWTLVVFQAFREEYQTPAAWSLTFPDGEASVLGVTTGDRAILAAPSDFEDGHAAGISAAGAFASANVGSQVSFHVEDALMGWASPDLAELAPGMTLNGPAGSEPCPCTFLSPMPSVDTPPGDYVVDITRAAAGHQSQTEAFVFLIDVKIPT